jgi:hypothetical protein
MEVTVLEVKWQPTLAIPCVEGFYCLVVSYTFSELKTATRLMCEKKMFSMGLQIYRAGPMASEPTLKLRKNISAVQDPCKMMTVYHTLYNLTYKTTQTNRPVTSYKGVIPTWFQSGDKH